MCRKPSRTFVLCKMNELSNTSMSGECGGGGGGGGGGGDDKTQQL